MVFMIHLMIYCKEGTNYYIMHAIYLKEGNKLVKKINQMIVWKAFEIRNKVIAKCKVAMMSNTTACI